MATQTAEDFTGASLRNSAGPRNDMHTATMHIVCPPRIGWATPASPQGDTIMRVDDPRHGRAHHGVLPFSARTIRRRDGIRERHAAHSPFPFRGSEFVRYRTEDVVVI